MDKGDIILCTICLLKVKVTEDILMCSGCRLWQHRACAPGVATNFYRDFYISVVRGDKPTQWTCAYCRKNGTQVKTESQTLTEKPSVNSPQTGGSTSDSDNSDYDEFALSQEIQRETHQGLPSPILSLNVTTTTTPSRHLQVRHQALDQHQQTFDSSRLHNTAYHEDSILDDSELNITPAALKLPENLATKSQEEIHYITTEAQDANDQWTTLSATYTLDPSSSDSDDSDPPPTPSTIPYCHSDMSFSDSESEIEFPPPKRLSTAPTPTRDTSIKSNKPEDREQDYTGSHSSDNSSSDDNDDEEYDRRVPPFRWGSSSDSEDESPVKVLAPPSLTFQLTKGPVSGGQTTLQDSRGYTYTVKFKIGVNTFWCCTEKSSRCQATAIQNRNIITPGAAKHIHPPRTQAPAPETSNEVTPEAEIDRFPSLRPDQDKPSRQPPKPQVEMLNIGAKEAKYILVDSNGFFYQDQEISPEARQTTWKCTKKTKSGACTGSIRLGENFYFMVVKAHNHPGDMKKVIEFRVHSKIKACIEVNPSKTPAQTLSHILLELGLTRQSLTKTGYQALLKQVRKQKQTLKCC